MGRAKKIKQHILYGSLTKSIYKEVIPFLVQENNDNMRGLSFITVAFGGILSVLSLFGVMSRRVLPAYLFLFISSVVIMIVRRLSNQKSRNISYIICITQCAALLTFGILNSTVCAPDPNQNGTIFVVMLLVVPFLLTDVPYRMDVLLVIATVVYCIMLNIYKAPHVISLDTTNAVSVCAVGCMCNWIFAGKNMQYLANRLYIEKERDSDALTGLLTKQSARILTDSHLGSGGKGVFVIIDLDNFKTVNDTYGHLYGDQVISKVADCIKANTRRTDVAARFGGDEFTIFYPDMDISRAQDKAEAFFKSLRESFANEKVHMTCSIGITAAEASEDYNKLFDDADKALYESKERGKDTYTIK